MPVYKNFTPAKSIPKKPEPRVVFDVVQDYYKNGKVEKRFLLSRIQKEWDQIVGKSIARRTESVFFKGRRLFVKINSAPLKQELIPHKNRMLQHINNYSGGDFFDEIILL